jgi:peroxin-14
MLDRNKDAQATILNDLQTEVKSLKSLLLSSRRPVSNASSLLDQSGSAVGVTSPSSETNSISPRLSAAFNSSARPGIPSWQMAAAKSAVPASVDGKLNGSSEKQPVAVEDAPEAASAESTAEAKDQ